MVTGITFCICAVSNPQKTLSTDWKSVNWVVVIVIKKKTSNRMDKNSHWCFQRDGTWHISLWQGQLGTKIAKTIIDRCHNKNISRISIIHVQFTDGWNNWKSGNYLGLDQSTMTDPLRILKSTILSGIVTSSTNMGKPNCDHLSLYCQCGQSRQDVTDTIARVRTVLHDHHWGKLPVHSIRLKILGGEYNECKVFMSSSLWLVHTCWSTS